MEINYSYYATSKGYKVVGGTAAQFLKADGSVDPTTYITTNTVQDVYAIKNFLGAVNNTYTGASIRIDGGGAGDTVYPTLAFHQPTHYVGTLSYRSDGFYFMNINGNAFDNVKANGYWKAGSDNGQMLLGGGADRPVSHFIFGSNGTGSLNVYSPELGLPDNSFKPSKSGFYRPNGDNNFGSLLIWVNHPFTGGEYGAGIAFNYAGTEAYLTGIHGDNSREPNKRIWHDKNLSKKEFVYAINGDEANNIASFDDLNGKTQVGSISADGNWWHTINIQHRNGLGDGGAYSGQIRFGMTGGLNTLQFRQNYAGTWQSWKTVYTNADFSVDSFVSNGNGKYFISFDGFENYLGRDGNLVGFLWHSNNFNPAQYVLQSSLNSQLTNYATLGGVQTFSNTITFLQAPIVPNGTIGSHAVNLSQLSDYYKIAQVSPANQNELLPNGLQAISTGDTGNNYDGDLSNKIVEGTFANFNGYDKNSKSLGFTLAGVTSANQGIYYKTWYGGGQTTWKKLIDSADLSYSLTNYATITQLNNKVENMEFVYGIGFSNGNPDSAPYFYHSTAGHRFLATQTWVNGQLGNYYTKNESLNLFVGKNGVETIYDTKTFNSSPIVPNATLGTHAVNLNQLSNYIPNTHPVNNITQTNINFWNNIASYAHQHSNYSTLENINQELATNSEVNFARVIVEDYVKAQNNFMSANEDPNTIFIPDGNTANIKDEIINEDYVIRLNPHEYNVDSTGYCEVNDKNRLIHVIGEQIKMAVNFKEIYPKQEIVIYNFDQAGNTMAVQVQGNTRYNINPGNFLRIYVTESLRVIAERQQQCDFIW